MRENKGLHMKLKVAVVLALLALPLCTYAQIDAPRKSISIGRVENNEVETPILLSPERSFDGQVSSGTLSIKSKMNLSEPLASFEKREVRFMDGEKFAKKDFTALENKMNKQYEKEDVGLKPEFYNDQYLGDFKSGSKFVKFLYRDHMYVDGDRVSISINDKVIHPNIYLQGEFQGFYFDLEKGFNKIDIIALNQGESGPNTAQFVMYDDNKQVISSNVWNLATGVKATVIIVKE